MAWRGPGPDYQVTSIELFRPVTNIDGNDIARVRGAVAEAAAGTPMRLAVRSVQYPRDFEPRIDLISGEDMVGFHEMYRLPFQRGDAGKLKDYLRKNVPDALYEPAEIPTLPIAVFGTRDQTGADTIFVTVGSGDRAETERRVIQRLIHGYYGLPETDEVIAESWPVSNLLGRLAVARISGNQTTVRSAVGVVGRVLTEQTGLLPAELQCGPVKRERLGVYRKRD